MTSFERERERERDGFYWFGLVAHSRGAFSQHVLLMEGADKGAL